MVQGFLRYLGEAWLPLELLEHGML